MRCGDGRCHVGAPSKPAGLAPHPALNDTGVVNVPPASLQLGQDESAPEEARGRDGVSTAQHEFERVAIVGGASAIATDHGLGKRPKSKDAAQGYVVVEVSAQARPEVFLIAECGRTEVLAPPDRIGQGAPEQHASNMP